MSWTTTGEKATADTHLEAKLIYEKTGEFLEEIDNFSSAQTDTKKGVLIITNMKTPTNKKLI